MGFFKKVVRFFTPDVVGYAYESSGNAFDRAVNKIMGSMKKDGVVPFEEALETEVLMFRLQSSANSSKFSEALSDKFEIYDEMQQLKYTVKGKALSLKRHLEVFNSRGEYVGMLKERLYTAHRPFSASASPQNFAVELSGMKLGIIKAKGDISDRKYKIGFNNWRIKGNVLSGNYSVFKEKEEVAR